MHYKIIPVTPFQQNCTLFWCDKTRHAAIIDPGGDAQQVVSQLKALELTPKSILLTHGHLDHAGGANELAQILGHVYPCLKNGSIHSDRVICSSRCRKATSNHVQPDAT